MKAPKPANPKRVAISLDIDWGYKRHLEVYAGCQKYADEAGWVCSINPAVHRMLGRAELPYDGVIARATTQLALAAKRAGIPLVNVWVNSPTRGLPSVFSDFEASGAMAAEHLLARGFRRFGYLGFLRDIDSQQQIAGFQKVVRGRGFPCSIHRVNRACTGEKEGAWEDFIEGLGKWIDSWERPMGVFVSQDLFSRFLIEICNAPSPSITSIDLGFGQVGYRAAALLDRLMAGQPAPLAPELVPPAELVSRQSTDVLAVGDPLVARAMRFIAETGHRRIQVKDVAAAAATTRRTLERRFREAMGRSIAGEVTRLRLQRAKRRMVETDASMKDVAMEAGFRTADHFGKVFNRVEGISPSQFRLAHQKAFPQRI
jgi:LacI family transcriptional regulator